MCVRLCKTLVVYIAGLLGTDGLVASSSPHASSSFMLASARRILFPCTICSPPLQAKLGSEKATIYKPTGSIYQLKMKQSRQTFAEVQQRFGTMAFHLRSFENTARASFGLKECVEHQIVQPFEMMQTNKGDYVAQFRFTVLLMPKGNLKITGLDLDEACYKTDKTVADEALVKLLSQPLSAKSSKKKNKKKKKTNGDDSAAAASASAAADK
eukprot:TRINITY_DN8121_c0_g1_i1.p2 TRINITY_DN8121_c0_g1~~TRINITY_DN8121_c0_g1_i1.p2  ORF type:complete len:212 (+),score=63.33 TRINITY_DN8121_c0_g1_i1:820-1455(+)